MKKTKVSKMVSIIAALIVALLVPQMGFNDYIITIFVQALLYSIIVLGLNFITGMTGQMNLGNAAVFGLGAYASALATTKLGISPWLAMLLVIAVGWLIGILLGYPSLRVKGVYLTLTTIAFNEIVRLCLQNMEWTGGVGGVRSIPRFNLFGLVIKTPTQNFYFILVILILFIIISHRFIHSKYGRAFIAVRDNVEAVETCGIKLSRIKVQAFTLSTIYGAVAGGLYASFMGYIAPTTFTMNLSMSFAVMLIIGGRCSIPGCIIGSFVIAFAPELLRFLGIYYQAVYAIVIMLALVFNPDGLVSLGPKCRKQFIRLRGQMRKKRDLSDGGIGHE